MNNLTPELTEFVQRTGVALQGYIPRAAAEIFGLLVVSADPLTTDEIAFRLHLSRAGVSSNLRILESHGVVERVHMPGARRDSFALCDEPFARILGRVSERFRELADAARETGCASPRLREMTRTFETASTSLEQWRNS